MQITFSIIIGFGGFNNKIIWGDTDQSHSKRLKCCHACCLQYKIVGTGPLNRHSFIECVRLSVAADIQYIQGQVSTTDKMRMVELSLASLGRHSKRLCNMKEKYYNECQYLRIVLLRCSNALANYNDVSTSQDYMSASVFHMNRTRTEQRRRSNGAVWACV